MARFRLAMLCCACLVSTPLLRAQSPSPDRLQTAMAHARELLQTNKPSAAVEALEKTLPVTDGDKNYL